MGVIIRQSAKSSVAIYLGVFVGVFNRLFLFPAGLTESQIGVVQVVMAIAILIAQLGQFGSSTTITKFFESFKKKELLPQFFGSIILISLAGFLLFSGVFLLFEEHVIGYFHNDLEQISNYKYHIIGVAFFMIVGYIFSAISHNNLRTTFPSLVNNFILKLTTSFALVLILYQFISFDSFISIYAASYALAALLILIYVKKLFSIKISFNVRKIQKSTYSEVMNYSFFVLVGAVSTVITLNLDALMLSGMEGLNATGIYTIAFFMGSVIEIPKRAINTISMPIIVKNWENENISEIKAIYQKTSIIQGIVGLLLFVLLFVNIDEIFSLLPRSEVFIIGKNVALIIGLSKVIDMITGASGEILRTSKHYRWDFILILFLILITIISNLIFIPIYSLDGAAIASLISIFLYNFCRFLLLKKLYNLTPFSTQTLKLIIIFSITLGIGYLLPTFLETENRFYTLINLIINSAIISSVFIFSVYRLKLSEELNSIIKKYLAKIRLA